MEQLTKPVEPFAPPAVALSSPSCLNCGSALTGPYCAECGQHDLPPEPPLKELVAEAWDAFVSVDGKVASTLKLLLLRPGALTQEYLQGRRARFLPPLRLYLICSVLFFLASAVKPNPTNKYGVARARADSAAKANVAGLNLSGVRSGKGLDSVGLAHRIDSINASQHNWLAKRLKINEARIGADGHNFTDDFKAQLPRMLFVLMPAFALLLAVAYWSRHRRYATHLIVSLHLHAFAFAGFAVIIAATWLPELGRKLIARTTLLWIVCYIPLALRRVYGGRLVPAAGRAAVLAVSYAVVAVLVFMAMALTLVLTY